MLFLECPFCGKEVLHHYEVYPCKHLAYLTIDGPEYFESEAFRKYGEEVAKAPEYGAEDFDVLDFIDELEENYDHERFQMERIDESCCDGCGMHGSWAAAIFDKDGVEEPGVDYSTKYKRPEPKRKRGKNGVEIISYDDPDFYACCPVCGDVVISNNEYDDYGCPHCVLVLWYDGSVMEVSDDFKPIWEEACSNGHGIGTLEDTLDDKYAILEVYGPGYNSLDAVIKLRD